MNTENDSPKMYALKGFLATPLLVLILVLGAAFFALFWPLVPVLLYKLRKGQIKNKTTTKEP